MRGAQAALQLRARAGRARVAHDRERVRRRQVLANLLRPVLHERGRAHDERRCVRRARFATLCHVSSKRRRRLQRLAQALCERGARGGMGVRACVSNSAAQRQRTVLRTMSSHSAPDRPKRRRKASQLTPACWYGRSVSVSGIGSA